MHLAALSGEKGIARVLLQLVPEQPIRDNPNPLFVGNGLRNSDGLTPADIAFRARDHAMLALLLRKRIVPLCPDETGVTAVQHACQQCDSETLGLLLATLSPMISDRNKTHPLEIAAWKQSAQCLQRILENCDEHERDDHFLRACHGSQHQIVSLYLKSGRMDIYGIWEKAWSACSRRDSTQVASVLLKALATRGQSIITPGLIEIASFEATKAKAAGCLEFIIKEKWTTLPKPSAQKFACNNLRAAIQNKDLKTMELLIAAGALAHSPERNDMPLLFMAISSQYLPAVRLVLTHGVSLNVSFESQSPLDWSLKHGTSGITELLRDKTPKKYQSPARSFANPVGLKLPASAAPATSNPKKRTAFGLLSQRFTRSTQNL